MCVWVRVCVECVECVGVCVECVCVCVWSVCVCVGGCVCGECTLASRFFSSVSSLSLPWICFV